MRLRSSSGVSGLWLVTIAIFTGISIAWSATELAKVNGRSITEKDLMTALGGVNDGQRQSLLKDSNSRKQIINGLIDQEILVQEAEKEKLDQDSEYKEAMANFRRQFLSNRVLQKNLGDKATEKAAKKFYETHKSRFSTDQVHAQHILLATEEQAKDLLKQAKAGADFQALAEKNSKDPSAKNNRGDLGFFGRDRMVPEFTEPAFSGKPGDIIGPVKTAYGYHVIKVIEKKPGKPLEYNEVELNVLNSLKQELTKNYIEKLRTQAKIQILESK